MQRCLTDIARQSDKGPTDPWPEAQAIGAPAIYPPGAILFRESDVPAAAYLIEDGLVKLTASPAGERPVVAGLRVNSALVGASAITLRRRHLTTASTLTACCLRQVSAANLSRLLETNPEVSHWVARALGRDVRDHIDWVTLFSSLDPMVRLRMLFAKLIRIESLGRPDGSIRLPPLLTIEEIAQTIARTRESVSRLLKDCEAQGTLRREKGWYVIPAGSPILALAASERD